MNRIKELREELKISQNELAKKLNKTQQMVSLYENGTYELDLDGYIILSKLFDCSIEYIAGKSDVRDTDLSNIRFAQHNGIDTNGLSEEDIEEIKKQVEYMRWKRNNQK